MREFFEGKSVALVGPADYLELFRENSENLKKIEECDVIVKLNSGINLSKKYPELVSKRIDILYNSLLDNCVNGGVLNISEIASSGIKHIRTTPKSNMKGIATNPGESNITKKETLEKLKTLFENHNIGTSIMDMNLYNLVSTSVKSKPTTGVVAIYDILLYNPKSLYITGFNFFMTPPLRGYWGAEESGDSKIPYAFTVNGTEKVLRSEKEHAEVVSNSKRHVHKYMWDYAKRTLVPSDIVEFDPILEKLLLVENFSKESYNEIVEEYSKGGGSE
tara:strand:+ start:81 stop:908 length:828 start_codon:yes stop_codon:yes gene_type:complete